MGWNPGRLIEALVPKINPDNSPVQQLVLDTIAIMNMSDVKSQVVTRDARGVGPIVRQITNPV